MNRSFDMTYDGERLMIVSSWIALLSNHWDHREELSICWNEALLSSDRAIGTAKAYWGINRRGDLPDAHWLLPCVVYFAPFIRACVIQGYFLPDGESIMAIVAESKNS